MDYARKLADLESRFQELEQACYAKDAVLSSHARVLDQLQANVTVLEQKTEDLGKVLLRQAATNSHVNSALSEASFTSSSHGIFIQQLYEILLAYNATVQGLVEDLMRLQEQHSNAPVHNESIDGDPLLHDVNHTTTL